MKRVISLIMALLPCAVAFADQKTDTLLSISRADSVVITDRQKSLAIDIVIADSTGDGTTSHKLTIPVHEGAERVLIVSDPRKSSRKAEVKKQKEVKEKQKEVEIRIPPKKGKSRWDAIIGGLGFGMVSALDAPPAMGRQMTKSWEVSMLYVLGVRYRLHKYTSLNFGFGLTGRSLKVGSGMRYIDEGAGVTLAPFPEGAVKTSAHVYTFSIDMPLLLRQHLPIRLDGRHRMSVVLGGILNFNTYSSVSSHYSMPGDRRYDEKLAAKHHRPVTWQLMGGIYFNNWLGAYVKYMPVEPIKQDAISYKPLSVGLQVSF